MLKEIHCLLVENDGRGRNTFRQALREIAGSVKIDESVSIRHASDHLETRSPPEVIFLSSDFDEDEASEFLNTVLEQFGSKPGLVLLLKGNRRSSAILAERLIQGIDAFLCEPYSAEQLLEVVCFVKEASQIQTSEDKRKEVASAMLLTTMAKGIDQLAMKRASGGSANRFVAKEVQNLSHKIHQLFESLGDRLELTLIDAFSKVKPPPSQSQKKSASQSNRKTLQAGEKILQVMHELNMERDQFFEMMNTEEEHLAEILNGKQVITSEVAVELARVLGRSKDFWLNC